MLTSLFVLGACLGSFANVVIARLPDGISVVSPRSRCPSCLTTIAWYDNIPLMSFLVLRARCRHCGARIRLRYFLVELLAASLCAALWMRFGWSWQLVMWVPLCLALLIIVFLDIDHWWVPDVITLPAMVFAFAASFLPGGLSWVAALLGAAPAGLMWVVAWLFERATGREGMGLGDMKLLAVIGLGLGAVDALSVLLLAAVQGSLIGGLVVLAGGHRGVATAAPAPESAAPTDPEAWVPPRRAIPFGPFLVLGAYEVVLVPGTFAGLPQRISGWLLGLMT
ncbi:MAG: prepilin peptidase [Deltaproteobacteria bacterium]|nr:prepilin peptidase [Deltaproteobacteria bacterium]